MENAKATKLQAPEKGTLDQQTRGVVTQNFKALKPFADRKRLREDTDFSDQFTHRTGDFTQCGSLTRTNNVKRVPLMKLSSLNTPPLRSKPAISLPDSRCCRARVTASTSFGEIIIPNPSAARTFRESRESSNFSDQFTPRTGGFTESGSLARPNSVKTASLLESSRNNPPTRSKPMIMSPDSKLGSTHVAMSTSIRGSEQSIDIVNPSATKTLIEPREGSGFSYQSSHGAGGFTVSGSLARTNCFKRAPLTELSLNTPPMRSKPKILSPEGRCSSSQVTTSTSFSGSERSIGVSNRSATGTSLGNECSSDTFSTRKQQPDCFNLNYSVSSPSLLDDDFDESVLQEIDAICRLRSALKEDCRSSCIGLQHAGKKFGESESCLADVSMEKFRLDSVGDTKSIEEISNHATSRESMTDDSSKYLESLNDKQREAAYSDITLPLMILAGPGSGKTSTMVGRVLVLLNEGMHPSNILAMTFTTAAASEMRDRVGAVAGKKKAKELTISTFHSFALQLCRSHAEKLGRTSDFSVYGQGQQRRAIIEAVRLYEESTRQNYKLDDGFGEARCPQYFKDKSKKWQKYVTKAKASGRSASDYRKIGDETGAAILESYNDILKTCNALDYHDLIGCSVRLLEDYPEVFEESQETWSAIIVDEFQDTSAMQYKLLKILASHGRITIVGDDDQSIFSFNGADISGFDSFRKDFPNHREVRLVSNYWSSGCIVDAATSIIRNNRRRCQSKSIFSENSHGSKITIKECHNEDGQCAFVIDKISEIVSDGSSLECSYGNIAILYRRQISGKVFQSSFRERRIPFNVHGVAFYRKKVVRAIIAMLRTALPECDDSSYRRVFKALLPLEKEEKKRVIEHIDKISTVRKCSFLSAAFDIFSAKVSGTFKRGQLNRGRKVLQTLEMISKLVDREQSLSAVVTSVANLVPQKCLLEQRAVLDVDGGKFLNEDNDLRSVLQYLLDDIADFLSIHFTSRGETNAIKEQNGCRQVLKAFIDYITERETGNFHSRKCENENSVTLTTIHQSKGLEWDIVFIVKANESEIPLLHEFNGVAQENGTSLEEERRLLYVAMTRARKKLYILYVTVDSNWQVLQPSRFLMEIPIHLLDVQGELNGQGIQENQQQPLEESKHCNSNVTRENQYDVNSMQNHNYDIQSAEAAYACRGNNFLKRFNMEDRAVVSHMFHNWAKKQAFQDPKRLLNKVHFVIDERLTIKKNKHKDVLRVLKSSVGCDEAFQYAEQVLRWEQIPADKRAHLMREKQEYFQKLRIENSMTSAAPTSKQIAYLQNLGCTIVPRSRLQASHLIEQYKSL